MNCRSGFPVPNTTNLSSPVNRTCKPKGVVGIFSTSLDDIVELSDQAGNYVAGFQIEIVVWTENVAGDDRSELAGVLFVVRSVVDVD